MAIGLVSEHQLHAGAVEALPDVKSKAVLITGVAGIGAGFAKLCVEKGAEKVFAVDRDQHVLDALHHHSDKLVKILADVGTEEGVQLIKKAVGSTTLHWVLLGAACPKNKTDTNMGCSLKTITRDEINDMIQTDVHGKLFVLQALEKNLMAAEPKARVFNLGAPFSDGPKPDGSYMVIPGWAGFGAAKAANKWVWEGMKVEMKDMAIFGYGHPGLTKTLLTNEVAEKYDKAHPMSGMVNKRFAAGDFHTPEESAALFYSIFSKTSEEDFSTGTWNIVRSFKEFGKELGVKATADVGAGIALPTTK